VPVTLVMSSTSLYLLVSAQHEANPCVIHAADGCKQKEPVVVIVFKTCRASAQTVIITQTQITRYSRSRDGWMYVYPKVVELEMAV